MTRTGDREIGVVSGRLPDNPGGLACMCSASRVPLEGLIKKERPLIVYQACSTYVRNTYCLVKDYK